MLLRHVAFVGLWRVVVLCHGRERWCSSWDVDVDVERVVVVEEEMMVVVEEEVWRDARVTAG